MESKTKTSTAAMHGKWTNYEKQTGIQYQFVAGNKGKPDRRWRFRFRFRGKLYSEVLGLESNGLSEKKIMAIWSEYAANRTLGNEPFSPGGAVDLQEAAREAAAHEAAEARSHTIKSLFAEAMQLREVSAKPGHIQRYTKLFENWISPVVGDLPIHGLKAVHVAQIIKAMQVGKVLRTLAPEEAHRYKEKPRSAQTQAHAWNALRVVWTYARDNRLVMGAFPGAKLKPKASNARHAYLTEEQAALVLADLRGKGEQGKSGSRGSKDAWGQALLSLHCGLRAGEIFNLTWRDANLSTGIGFAHNTKNKGLSRKFYMSPQVKEMLAERQCISKFTKPGDYIFPSRTGEKLTEVGDIFARCFKRLGINKGDEDSKSKIVFHSFRHTFATWLAQRGVPMSVLAELMGHDITKTTERYVQYAPTTMIKDAVSFFAELAHGQTQQALEDREHTVDIQVSAD